MKYPEQRRIDLQGVEKNDPPRWCIPSKIVEQIRNARRGINRNRPEMNLAVGRHGIKVKGISDEDAICSLNTYFLIPSTPLGEYLIPFFESCQHEPSSKNITAALLAFSFIVDSLDKRKPASEVEK